MGTYLYKIKKVRTMNGEKRFTQGFTVAVEMAQWLGALAVLLKDLDSIPSTHMATCNCLTLVPGDLTSLHRNMCGQNTNAHTVKINH